MAIIKPFKRLHYAGGTGCLERLIAPPYDVISPEQQAAFYEAHERNIIRVVLGKQYPEDSETDNRYTRAAATLKQWIEQGVLVSSERCSLTIYQMEFERPDGGRRTIDGIAALVRVEDYGKGKVLPHEKTYRGPKQDQLNLLRSCRAHLTPIHGLFNDRENAVMREYKHFMTGPPDQEAVGSDGTRHRTWILDDENSIERIKSALRNKSIFIADGHNRYETSLAYRNEIRESGSGDPDGGHEYVMMYLTSTSHPGLTILPAHRMVKGLDEDVVRNMLDKLRPYFEIEELSCPSEETSEAARVLTSMVSPFSYSAGNFGVLLHYQKGVKVLKLKSLEAIDPLIDPAIPRDLRYLDVTILREVVMDYGLDLHGNDAEGHIEYTPSPVEALEKVKAGEVQVCFVLNPTRVEQVQAAAELGHKLPQKATYFYPKLASGLIMNVF